MSNFNKDNKNKLSNVSLEKISLEKAFLGKELNHSSSLKKPAKFMNTSNNISTTKSSQFTLNDKYKVRNPTIKMNTKDSNTKELIKYSHSQEAKRHLDSNLINEKNTNEDVQEKFDVYLKRLNKIAFQFKTFKERTQDLTENLSLLNRDKQKTDLKEDSVFHSYSRDNMDSGNQDKVEQEANTLSDNSNFAFKDFEHYNKELYKKQFKLLETIDIEPVIITKNKDKTLNSTTSSDLMKQYPDNKVLENLENTIETKLNLIVGRFIPYFTNISNELRQITDKLKDSTDHLSKNIETKLNSLENDISNLAKTTDINSLELENLQEKLKFDGLNDLLNSIKNISVRINNLFLKYEDERLENTELLRKINKLESTFNNTVKSQSEELEEKLDKLQNHITLSSEKNNNDLLSKIKDIFKIFSDSPDVMTMLEKSISNIRLKQDDLLKNAITIKEQLLNNSKEISSIKDSHKEQSKIFEIVNSLQNNQKNNEDQSNFNEKIHKDMEIIKKNIIKIMQEQQLHREETNLGDKHTSQEVANALNRGGITSGDKQDHLAVKNKDKSDTSNNSNSLHSKKEQTVESSTKPINENDNKASKMQETITKLKGALDLEGATAGDSINKEDVNKVLKSATKSNNIKGSNSTEIRNNSSKKSSENPQNDSTQKNSQKQQKASHNSVFVLDNSKFFK